jgi:hypothetical protein
MRFASLDTSSRKHLSQALPVLSGLNEQAERGAFIDAGHAGNGAKSNHPQPTPRITAARRSELSVFIGSYA